MTPARAILFDLFGTLVTLTRDRRPYRRLCRALGCPGRLRESLVVDAPTLADFCAHLGFSPPANIAALQQDLEADVASARPYDDTLAVLDALRARGTRIAVVSNLATPYARALDVCELRSRIDAAILSCEVGVAKPAPAIYERALAALGVDAADALMIGDSQRADVDGPRACGVPACLLDRDEGDLRSVLLA